jgi:hypothetical protein
MAAILIGAGIFDRKVDESGVFVHRNLRPDAGVAVERPRVLFPRVVAELAGPGNRVELPQLLARADVEGAHETFGVVVRDDLRAFFERRANQHDIFGDRRRGV